MAPPSDPASPPTPASAPRHPYLGQRIANSRCSLASPSSSPRLTAQALIAAPLLWGGSYNSLPSAFVPAPGCFDGLPLPLCQASPILVIALGHYSQLSVPAQLSQRTSWPALCPSSGPGVGLILKAPVFQLGSSCSFTSLLPTLPLTDKCVTSELLKGIPLATGDTSPEPELLPGGE